MATNNVILTQYSDRHTYCRLWDNSASAFLDNDAESLSIGGTPFALWADDNDILYVGRASTFKSIGFKCGTAGVGYGTFAFQYSITSIDYNIIGVSQGDKEFTIDTDLTAKFKDGYVFTISGSTANDGVYTCDGDSVLDSGDTVITVVEAIPDPTVDGKIDAHSIWGNLTASVWHNSTTGFTTDGWLCWTIPGTWGLSTVDSVSAYWVRAYQSEAAPATPATAYHLMRNVTLRPPIHVSGPEYEIPRMYRDINGIMRNTDLTYSNPTRLTLNVTQMVATQANCLLMEHWEANRTRIYIEDLARTTASPDLTADAYYTVMQGFLKYFPVEWRSPSKMALDRGGYYPIAFDIDVLTETTFTRMGGT